MKLLKFNALISQQQLLQSCEVDEQADYNIQGIVYNGVEGPILYHIHRNIIGVLNE